MRLIVKYLAILFSALLAAAVAPASVAGAQTEPPYPVGIRQIEFLDGSRPLALALFYPARTSDKSATPFKTPFFVNLHLNKDAELASADGKYPLVMFSHGRARQEASLSLAGAFARSGFDAAGASSSGSVARRQAASSSAKR